MRRSSGDSRLTFLFGAQRVPLGACPRECSDTLLGYRLGQVRRKPFLLPAGTTREEEHEHSDDGDRAGHGDRDLISIHNAPRNP